MAPENTENLLFLRIFFNFLVDTRGITWFNWQIGVRDYLEMDRVIRVQREMVMKKLAAVIAILALCSTGYATITEMDNGPDWRGDEGTTYQAWSFNDGVNPTVPDVLDNDYGGATLDVTSNSITTMLLPVYNGRTGVMKVMANDLMIIDIFNTPNTEPETWKEIWLQIIYADPGGAGFDVPIVTQPGYSSFRLESREELGSGYLLDTYSIIIEPNPPEERILLMAIQQNIYISAVAVDTKCIPEPASICLFGLGILGLLRKRRA